MGMSQDQQDLPRQSCKAQYKEEEGEADQERTGETTSQNGQDLQLRNTLREAEDREGWRKLVAKSSRGAPTVIQTTGHR